jgi:hypothetical protein
VVTRSERRLVCPFERPGTPVGRKEDDMTTLRAAVARPLAGVAIALGLLAISGCGDDPEPLSKPEFVARADAICEDAQAEAEPLWTTFWADFEQQADGDVAWYRLFDSLLDELQPITERQLEDLRELAPPAADEELIEGLLDDFEAGIDEMNDLADRAVDGDEAAREALTREEGDPLADVNRAARDYGLELCGAES